MTVVDASVWVSSVLVNDVNHPASTSWFVAQTKSATPIIVPALFIAKVAGAVTRRTGVEHVGTRSIQDILAHPAIDVVAVDQALGTRAVVLAARLSLRGSDAVYMALAERLGIPLVTWDVEQFTRAAPLIITRHPLLIDDQVG